MAVETGEYIVEPSPVEKYRGAPSGQRFPIRTTTISAVVAGNRSLARKRLAATQNTAKWYMRVQSMAGEFPVSSLSLHVCVLCEAGAVKWTTSGRWWEVIQLVSKSNDCEGLRECRIIIIIAAQVGYRGPIRGSIFLPHLPQPGR